MILHDAIKTIRNRLRFFHFLYKKNKNLFFLQNTKKWVFPKKKQ